MPGKEPMTPDTFDEDDYANDLIDKEGYSEVTARMLAKKKKATMETKKIEIDLNSLAKAKKKVRVKATASRKAHYREQEVGGKGDQSIVSAIDRAQSEGDNLKGKMNAMIDKYYHGEEISPENKKKIDAVENQMKGAYAERDSLRRRYRETTAIK